MAQDDGKTWDKQFAEAVCRLNEALENLQFFLDMGNEDLAASTWVEDCQEHFNKLKEITAIKLLTIVEGSS